MITTRATPSHGFGRTRRAWMDTVGGSRIFAMTLRTEIQSAEICVKFGLGQRRLDGGWLSWPAWFVPEHRGLVERNSGRNGSIGGCASLGRATLFEMPDEIGRSTARANGHQAAKAAFGCRVSTARQRLVASGKPGVKRGEQLARR